MSKSKNTNKILVRNTSVPTRPGKTVEKSHSLKKVHFSDDVSSQENNRLAMPEFCTLLQLAEEMKAIRNAQCSSRSLPEVTRHKTLNFLPEERIYQDLVGIDVPEEGLVSEVRSLPCLKLKKDPDIDFNKYTKYDLEPEYVFTSYAVPVAREERTVFNGHSVYNKMAMWSDFAD